MIPEGGTPRQVFVDDSGRRRRWTRLAGAGVTALCAAYIAITVAGLSQTTIGPLIAVPASGNGEVAGFPDSSGTVPGLLADGGVGAAAPKAATAKPQARAVAPKARAVAPTKTTKRAASTPEPATSSAVGRAAATSRSRTSGAA